MPNSIFSKTLPLSVNKSSKNNIIPCFFEDKFMPKYSLKSTANFKDLQLEGQLRAGSKFLLLDNILQKI